MEADVDDSVNFQVYQNQAQAEITDEAVACTKGQVMTHNGELIQAYYFSTSAGTTSTDQIWGADSAAPFLKSVACRFDQDQPWGSWKVDITSWEKLEDSTAMYNKGKLQGLLVTKKSESRCSYRINCKYRSWKLSCRRGIMMCEVSSRRPAARLPSRMAAQQLAVTYTAQVPILPWNRRLAV